MVSDPTIRPVEAIHAATTEPLNGTVPAAIPEDLPRGGRAGEFAALLTAARLGQVGGVGVDRDRLEAVPRPDVLVITGDMPPALHAQIVDRTTVLGPKERAETGVSLQRGDRGRDGRLHRTPLLGHQEADLARKDDIRLFQERDEAT